MTDRINGTTAASSELEPIFVFGANFAGRHGKGAALHARQHYGARYGCGFGRTGNAWAIPTKGYRLEALPLEMIETHIQAFIAYARANPDLRFKVTPVGTGLAGYRHEQIAPMFASAPLNCVMPDVWAKWLPKHEREVMP